MTEGLSPVVVLKVGDGRCAALGVIRSLGRIGVPVYLVHGDRRAPAARSRYLRGMSAWDVAGDGADQRLERLLDVADRLDARPVLVPTDDVGALFVASHAEALAERFRFPRQPPGVPERLANKRGLHELCERLGIPAPWAAFPSSRDEASRFAHAATFPVVAKALDPVALGARPGAKSVTITQTPAELLAAYAAAEVEGRANVMLQEHIPGRSDTVWMFNGYFDEDSRCLFGGTARKVRQYPPYSGMTVLGTCVRNDTVSRMACDLLRETGYRGIVDLGFRYDARDGTYKLLDVNPRIGATFRLFVSSGGMDVARAQYLDLTGRPVRPHTLEDGRSWIVETNDPASALRYWADGTLTAGEWVRSLRGVRESAYLAADDLAPTLAAYRWHLGLALGRLRRKVTQPTE